MMRTITLIVAVALLLASGAVGDAWAALPVSSFVEQPRLASPAISPNGKYLAVAKRDGSNWAVSVIDLDTSTGHSIKAPADTLVDWIVWANDDRLLLSVTVKKVIKIHGTHLPDDLPASSFSRVIAIDRDGKNSVALFNNQRTMLLEYWTSLTNVVHPLPNERDFVLMGATDPHGDYNLYRVNVVDGKAEVVQRGTRRTFNWLTDLQGNATVRWDVDVVTGDIQILLRRGDAWDNVAHYHMRDMPDLKIIGFGDDPTTAIVARQSGNYFGLFEYNIVSRSLGKPLLQRPGIDVGWPVGSAIYDPYSTKLVGFTYVEDVWLRHYLDPELAGLQLTFDQTFPDEAVVTPTSWSADRKRFVVYTESAKNPGGYFLYDAAKRTMASIGKRYPSLVPQELGEVLIVKYAARDGTKIPGYLTMPPGKGSKNLPLVVMPHGGPELRDVVQFDTWAQSMANRGYAVFQPNFRGSGGYGKAFVEAGFRQWGRLMQNDITDGVKALIADGTVDANRICIVGASYGGYAALAGGAFTPDLYKCVVSVAGISDLPAMMRDEGITRGSDSPGYIYWRKWVGDPKADLEQMRAVSPAFHAANFRAPVLLIHGKWDTNVRYHHSVTMEKALRKEGKPVELIVDEYVGHDFEYEERRLKMYEDVERFVSAHIGK